jgi:DNA polymerase III alpha subunit
MLGSQKSSKINSLKDQYGRVVYNRHELYDMLYAGEDISSVTEVDWHEDFEKYNSAIDTNHLQNKLFLAVEKLSLSKDEFDRQNQREWFMPDEYKNIDLHQYCLDRCPDETEECARICNELYEFEQRDLFNLLRYIIYLVDTMRENNIVWGVGRGSSVASYVLYIIGIHRINSIQYNLDYKEFLR